MYIPTIQDRAILMSTASSALYNATAFEYDPYTHEGKIIAFPGITGDADYHVGGIDMDQRTGSVYIGATAGAPFNTNGKNLTGPNHLIRYDTGRQEVLWIADLAGFQAEILAETGQFVSGFQDMAEDPRGNCYMLASFGNAIARIDPTGRDVSVFYNSGVNDSSILGIGGLFTVDDTLVVSDDRSGEFLVFDTKSSRGVARFVEPEGQPAEYTFTCDGLTAPERYGGTVALCSNDFVNGTGGIAVYQSLDGWQSAQWKGFIANDDPVAAGSTPTATVEIAGSIYISEEFFPPGLATGNATGGPEPRSSFPFVDITEQVDSLVGC